MTAWADRLCRDRASLRFELTGAQDDALQGILAGARASGELEFLVVYGSVSRGEQREDSDLDVYYETRDVAVELQEADPQSPSHVFGALSGSLKASLRRGDTMAATIASDALVVFDDGSFRSLVAENSSSTPTARVELAR